MKTDFFPTYDAIGVCLTHPLKLSGRLLPAGHCLTQADTSLLRMTGTKEIYGCRPDNDDIPVDTALDMLAAVMGGEQTARPAAEDKRLSFYATTVGLSCFDRERVDRFNRQHPGLSLSTIPPFEQVERGQLLATLSCTDFFMPEKTVTRCQKQMAEGPLVTVSPYREKKIALIQPSLQGVKQRRGTDYADIITHRLQDLCGYGLYRDYRCPHTIDALEKHIRLAFVEGAELILIAPQTPTSGANDILPTALDYAGGEIVQFGFAAAPGSDAFFGRCQGHIVVGLPGPLEESHEAVDMILLRLMADIPFSYHGAYTPGTGGQLTLEAPLAEEDIAPLFVGLPEKDGARIPTIILAAGKSTRLPDNKLLENVAGKTVLEWTLDAVLDSKTAPVIVVTGYEADKITPLLKERDVRTVFNPHYEDGVATSIEAGLKAAPADTDAVLLLSGDMPGITTEIIDTLCAAFDPASPQLCLPSVDGQHANPGLWPVDLLDNIRLVPENAAKRHIFMEVMSRIQEVNFDADPAFASIKRAGDLLSFMRQKGDMPYEEIEVPEMPTGNLPTQKSPSPTDNREDDDEPPPIIYL